MSSLIDELISGIDFDSHVRLELESFEFDQVADNLLPKGDHVYMRNSLLKVLSQQTFVFT